MSQPIDYTICDRIIHHLGGTEFLVKSTAYRFRPVDGNGLSFHQHAIFKSVRNPIEAGKVVIKEWPEGYELMLFKRRNKWKVWELFWVEQYLTPQAMREAYAIRACTKLSH